MRNAFASIVQARPGPTFGRPVHLSEWPPLITARYFSSNPSDSTSRWTPCPPEYCEMAASDPPWLVSSFRFRARVGFFIPSFLSGQRGVTPAFGYGAPHPSAGGTLTLLSNALLSAHYGQLRPSLRHRYSSSWCPPLVISLCIQSEVLTFRTKACVELMPPIHRLPPGQ
jgi:hypothetical protein